MSDILSPKPIATATAHSLLILNGIPGPITSTAAGLTDPSFQVVWYQFNIMHEATSAVSGVHQGSGRISQTPFRVVILDHATTGIFNAFVKGSINTLIKVGLTQRLGPDVSPLLVFELKNVRISAFHQIEWSQIKNRNQDLPFSGMLNLEDAPDFSGSQVLELHLVPEEIVVSYTPATTDGTIGGVISQSWNALTQAIT